MIDRYMSFDWFCRQSIQMAEKPSISDGFTTAGEVTLVFFGSNSSEDWLAGPKGEGWCPRPELNWDQSFRKRLLYPFELRGQQSGSENRLSPAYFKFIGSLRAFIFCWLGWWRR